MIDENQLMWIFDLSRKEFEHLTLDEGDYLEITKFLNDYPGMSLSPSRSSSIILKGTFSFEASSKKKHAITDSYELQITVPAAFPKALPEVIETEGKIPRDGKHHVNHDKTLCLGSPLRLLFLISSKPTLIGFAEKCIVPFLYAVSYKLLNGGDFIFNELPHGNNGLFEDYFELFGVKTRDQVINILRLIGTKRRIANKKPCPCGCGTRLGKCNFNKKIHRYRAIAQRAWFLEHAAYIGGI